jgi:MFS family permease
LKGNAFARIVWPLATAEIVVWATLYYLFPALLPEWEQQMGWSKTDLSAAFSLALITTALFAPFVGRLIDHGHGRRVYVGGVVLGVVVLLGLSRVNSLWQFYLAFFGLGIAMSSSLYEACFALLTRTLGDQSKKAITIITLIGGLAGSVAFPSAHALTDAFGWRTTVVIFACATAFIALPLIWIGASRALQYPAAKVPSASTKATQAMSVTRSPTFWLLAVAFMMIAIDHGMLITHILPILSDRGVQEQTAILAASMIGPMQVAGRLAMMAAERYVATLVIAMGCSLVMTVAAAALLGVTSVPGLLAAFVILQGAGYGVTSIMRPVVIAELFGRENFGIVSGMLSLPFMSGYALAPILAALVWKSGGYDAVIMLSGLASICGLICLVITWKTASKPMPYQR